MDSVKVSNNLCGWILSKEVRTVDLSVVCYTVNVTNSKSVIFTSLIFSKRRLKAPQVWGSEREVRCMIQLKNIHVMKCK